MNIFLVVLACLVCWTDGYGQDVLIRAVKSPQPVAADGAGVDWSAVPASTVTLMGQKLLSPQGGGAVPTAEIRAIHDGKRLAVRLKWADPTRDASTVSAEQFSDGCAVQWPVKTGTMPSFLMGEKGNPVSIWYWRAAWETGATPAEEVHPRTVNDGHVERAFDFLAAREAGNPLAKARKTPVAQAVAEGFGTISPAQDQPLSGRGEWVGGFWTVVFTRPLVGSDESPAFKSGAVVPVAFAVYDGSSGERNGQKSLSNWQEMAFEPAPARRALKGVQAGRRVFDRYSCAACHGADGKGGVPNPNSQAGPTIPVLTDVFDRFTEAEVKDKVLKGFTPVRMDPKGPLPPRVMPNWSTLMTAEETAALLEFLHTLKAPKKGGEEW